MENIHGVDVSWLHRSTTDPSIKRDVPLPARTPTPPPPPLVHSKSDSRKSIESFERTSTKSTSEATPTPSQPVPKPSSRRPGILGRLSSDKPFSSSPPQEDVRSSKRSSWRSSLSSKFSSAPPADPPASSGRSAKLATSPLPRSYLPDTSNKEPSVETFEDEDDFPNASPHAKSGSFFSSAFRRLSSTGPQPVIASTIEQAPLCERKVLNVDRGRDRPSIKELKPAQLRRVSFSVDVEVAGNSRYPTEESKPEDDSSVKKTKKKEKKIKERAEGESLKHPGLRKGETEKEGLLHALGRDGMFDIGAADDDDDNANGVFGPASPPDSPGTKQQKEKEALPKPSEHPTVAEFSEPESKEPKVVTPPDQPTDTSGALPMPDAPEHDDSAAAPVKPAHKSNDRPTTDPLRIYRRCCQLREAPVLKRISEQLANPNNCGLETPGVVSCLNLTKSRMQLPDIVCLSDWLAVVPVKKLLLEDANLTDESVRIILAGLLAAKLPEMHKRKRGRSSPSRLRENHIIRTPGVIEKITLTNNRKLTAEAWRHICLFIHMSKSLRAIDVSMVVLPKSFPRDSSTPPDAETSPAALLSKSISDRHAGDHLEELIFGECDLDADQVDKITAAASHIRLKRLGLAGNHLDQRGLEYVARYLKSNVCKGLDLGGNNLRERLPIITDALTSDNVLWALCLANCNLDVASLGPLFPALVALPDVRFLDFSHNKELFSRKPTALTTLRTYLPQLPLLKRIHLMGVSMSPADAIGLAEIIPEVRNLAHLNILENPQLSAILSATDTTSQEEACALYASIMTAVRLSKTLICVDVDVPGEGSSEVVKALARQTFAYCLRTMERFSDANVLRLTDAAAALPDVSAGDVGLLSHIAGPSADGLDDQPQDETKDGDDLREPARREDFIVGGRGWVKALSHCLEAAEFRRVSISGDVTPQVMDSAAGKAKAKEVSKTLLSNARIFKIRLESTIAREEKGDPGEEVMRRLQFLHHALNSMIEKFEHEYPDTRIKTDISATGEPAAWIDTEAVETSDSPTGSRNSSPSRNSEVAEPSTTSELPTTLHDFFDNDSTYPPRIHASSRRGSEVELHNRKLTLEEGHMHKIGQRFRRDVLPPAGQTDHLHGTSEKDAPEAAHLAKLRQQLEEYDGDEIRDRYTQVGLEGILKELKFEEVPQT